MSKKIIYAPPNKRQIKLLQRYSKVFDLEYKYVEAGFVKGYYSERLKEEIYIRAALFLAARRKKGDERDKNILLEEFMKRHKIT